MHPHRPVRCNRDLSDFGAHGRLPLGDSDAAPVPGREWSAPAGLCRRQLQRAEMAGLGAEQLASQLVGIAARRRRDFVEKAFDDKRVLRRAHRTPESERNREVCRDLIHEHVRERVRDVGGAINEG